jgi:hypothetical protein
LYNFASGVYENHGAGALVRVIICVSMFLIDAPELPETLDLSTDEAQYPIRIDL